ncbi:MAG TPA: PilN domain-containing protein [Gemmatimonadales bacterium]|nr:PilN domain-containing protein [Gemmatimonadales bacterium]
MINVNLRPGLKRKRAGSSLNFKGLADRFQGFGGSVKDPMLMAAGVAWVVAIGFLGVMWVSTQRELSALEPQLEQTRSEHSRFQTFLAQKHKQEVIRDSLLAQIGVIRSVDGDRYVWPHVMDEVAKALPAYTWLTGVFAEQAVAVAAPLPAKAGAAAKADSAAAPPVEQALKFRIEGRTVDIQAYTRFLRQLEASPWLHDVTAVSVSTVVEQERPVTAFVIRSSFAQADSAYVRTVSLSESVR